tara:strand:- start:18087 stop:19343 length:1257 start_codon:yes stop_codon:yes gene_type:complete
MNDEYKKYIEKQSEKTLDPARRKKWLGEEWQSKIDGFKNEFSKFGEFLTNDKKCLCLGARTGQEVVALKEMGIENAIGIDIVPHEPYVIEGDIHNLDFEDDSFDFIYTNIIDHSIDPKKMISEIERVLKVDGIFFLQIQVGLNQDEYTVFEINNPLYDIATLFDQSFCLSIRSVNQNREHNFAGMNVELIFRKDEKLSSLYKSYGNLSSITVPEKYNELWENINLPIQTKKLDNSKILEEDKRTSILSGLKKRAYFLTRIAEAYDSKNILEIGTAEGWQFFSFGEYAKQKNGIVISCDPRDVRNKKYINEYEGICYYFQDTSKFLGSSNQVNDIDFFYIDGLHDEGTVITDLTNLINKQSSNPVWVFDDFDTRFGCFKDIASIVSASNGFKIWNIGLTASGHPSHQVMVNNRFEINEN